MIYRKSDDQVQYKVRKPMIESYTLNKIKDYTLNSEQQKEYKAMVAQIKKIGPGIVNKYNRDSKLIDSLKKALPKDLAWCTQGVDPKTKEKIEALSKGINYKFEFSLYEYNHSAAGEIGEVYAIEIEVLNKSINSAFHKAAVLMGDENDPDEGSFEENIKKCTKKMRGEITKEIMSKVKGKTVSLIDGSKSKAFPDSDNGVIAFVFDPKDSSANESASLLTEAADSSKAYNNQWKYKIPLKSTKVFDELEKSEGVTIPDELREFIEKTNGATPDKYLFTMGKTERCYGATLSFNKGEKDHDTAFAASEIFDKGLVPMGIDPFGNYICYNPKNGAIMFWNHESDSVSKVADTLSSFLSSLHKVEKK